MPTLSDHLSVPDSPDLRDLLKSRRFRRRRSGAESDKREIASPSTAAAGARTLSDFLRDEEGSLDGGGGLRWRNLRRLRRAAAAWPASGHPMESAAGDGQSEQPVRLSLMALPEQTERRDGVEGVVDPARPQTAEVEGEGSHVCRCCVCMVRHKGAAFIPCGHTYCRTCARKLWVRSSSCPLCNAAIFDILHLY